MNVKHSLVKKNLTLKLPKLEASKVPPDGVLPHHLWDEDLVLEVPLSEGTPATSEITLTVNGVRFGRTHVVTYEEAANPLTKFPFVLQSSAFPSGNPLFSLSLNYEVVDNSRPPDVPAPIQADRFILIFDKEAPGAVPPNYLGFTQKQLQGIYSSDFTDGNLEVDLSPWPKMAAGDTLTPWLAIEPADASNTESGLLKAASISVNDDNVGTIIKVKFPKSALAALGEVPQYFGYQLKDKLGNTSDISLTRTIPVYVKARALRPEEKPASHPQPRVVRTRSKGTRADAPFLYPPTIAGLRPLDGRIKVAALSAPVRVVVPMPDNPIAGNTAQVYINRSPIGQAVEVPLGGADFTLTIDPSDLGAATRYPFETWQVDYSYADPIAGNELLSEQPAQLIIDRHAPGGRPPVPPPIAFTEEQLAGITEDDIDPVQDGLIVQIATWFDNDVDDQIELWLGTGLTEASGKYLSTLPPPVSDPSAEMHVVIPRADLEAVGSNPVYFGYRITDWAGNVSQLATVTPVNVFLTGAPGDLLRPLVPDAAPYNPEDGSGAPASTGLLIWTEANPETTVQIPIYTNAAAGDRITILWNGQTVPAVTVTQVDIDDEPTNGYLLQVRVPLQYISAGSPGPNIRISYRVEPSNGTPSATSPIQYINVNLTTPGGPDPDPDPTTPEHENLRALRVLSTFPGSSANIITPEAYTSPANLTVFRPGEDNTVTWLIGDRLNIFWGADHSNDPPEIVIDSNNESSHIIITLDAAFIAANGTGQIPVYYTLTRDLGNGNEVTVRSVDTIVQVQSPAEAPGGLAPLAQAVFPDSRNPTASTVYRFIAEREGSRGTSLQIPLLDSTGQPLANVAAGDYISVDFVGVNDPLDGPGHDIDPTNPPIEDSRISISDHVILASELAQGFFSVALPYATTYYICRNLSVTNYSIRNAAAITKNAPQTLILFAMNQPGGFCNVPTLRK